MALANNKGFTEIIRMLIIVSFIAVIYMTGIYIWQYIETQKRLGFVVEQLNKILEESMQRRQDSMNFGFSSQGGCANLYVYNFNKERSVSLSAFVDVKKLGLINDKKAFFDVDEEGIEIKLYRGEFVGYLHCTNQLSSDLLEYEVLEARAGQVGVMLDDYNFVDQYLEDFDYKATVVLKDISFVDNDGKEMYIKQYMFDSVDVGWLAN